MQTSINSNFHKIVQRESPAPDQPWFQRARPLPVQTLRCDFRGYLKVRSLKDRARGSEAIVLYSSIGQRMLAGT